MKLEDLTVDAVVHGILPDDHVTVVRTRWFGSAALELIYRGPDGAIGQEILYRTREEDLSITEAGRPWSFDGDGARFRLVSEAQRVRLAHLFDAKLAVHSSIVEPLPHQITAVYDSMLPRQPLRFLLADDPGAGKTIMAGLLIKELIIRGDVERCLVVCPGSLVEQWQYELYSRFQLPFEILTNDKLASAHTGNWFLEADLVIARLDKVARDERVHELLQAQHCQWDMVICDEAHKMSATFFGTEVKYTKRYRLGQLLSRLTRHFLLMTATPHNGKETDFQLFMALIDEDRFEGRFRDGAHNVDVSDLMRRMVKEDLLRFDGTPLFPERIAETLPYNLSKEESELYRAVTEYVREEFNRAEALKNNKRAGTVGFALTVLQRRLASSPEAIFRSLQRRRERLEHRLQELKDMQHGGAPVQKVVKNRTFDEYLEYLEDAPDDEVAATEDEVLDQATAARSAEELKAEIKTLRRLERIAGAVRQSGEDAKWRSLAELLQAEIFMQGQDASAARKLVIFTEHKDTLSYLQRRITSLMGREDAIVVIHGSVAWKDRLEVQERFRNDPAVHILLATDAAGEGINLQRAHLMVNYDLPWNPNRLEQRFGRIHRIGQTEVCRLWNLVANGTREGDVYLKLLEKLKQARESLGGRVFDVLGKLQFEGRSLRDLLLEAIRYGEQEDVRARLTTAVDNALGREKIKDLMQDHSLVQDTMDTSKIYEVREEMERAEARRLQPHYIESFFLEAFSRMNGSYARREAHRYEISHVPERIRKHKSATSTGEPVVSRYERITFDKSFVSPRGKPKATFICPGHPLLEAVTDLVLEQNRELLKQGAVLVDERDAGTKPHVLFYLEHAIQDGSLTRGGTRRVISKRMLYVTVDVNRETNQIQYAPYLDYRPLRDTEPPVKQILARPECAWVNKDLEAVALEYAVRDVAECHLKQIREPRLDLIAKTRAAVKDRLTKEIMYWDSRAALLAEKERAGKPGAKLNSGEARKRANLLQERLQRRLRELKREEQISPLPPVVRGGLLVVPMGLIDAMQGGKPTGRPIDTQKSAARARRIIMGVERRLGHEPEDREFDKLGYDIESRVPNTGRIRFIEVKGRVSGAPTITVTRNEILYSLNKPDDYILGIVEFLDESNHRVGYVRKPFGREPDFGVTSVNYDFLKLLERAEEPS